MTEASGAWQCQDGHSLAWRRTPGRGPTVVWLGGFHSDMTGTKAQALADWGAETGHDVLRFDYFGHGHSSGRFADGTISRWREDVLSILDGLTDGPVVLVGSSMGGWLAVLAALKARDAEGAEAAMRTHLLRQREALRELARQQPSRLLA